MASRKLITPEDISTLLLETIEGKPAATGKIVERSLVRFTIWTEHERVKWSDLDERKVRRFLADMQAEYSAATIIITLTHLKTMFDKAVSLKYLDVNPASAINMGTDRMVKAVPIPPDTLEAAITRLREDDMRVYAILQLLLANYRPKKIITLRACDFDSKKWTLLGEPIEQPLVVALGTYMRASDLAGEVFLFQSAKQGKAGAPITERGIRLLVTSAFKSLGFPIIFNQIRETVVQSILKESKGKPFHTVVKGEMVKNLRRRRVQVKD